LSRDNEREVFVCETLNIPMVRNSISCDQIRPNEGYVVGNISFMCWLVNRCKTKLPCTPQGLEDLYNFIIYHCEIIGVDKIEDIVEKTDFHKAAEMPVLTGHYFEKGEIVKKIMN
jgi:hypothetical protein